MEFAVTLGTGIKTLSLDTKSLFSQELNGLNSYYIKNNEQPSEVFFFFYIAQCELWIDLLNCISGVDMEKAVLYFNTFLSKPMVEEALNWSYNFKLLKPDRMCPKKQLNISCNYFW